ncbi:hypothetical protein GCM10010320_46000 [Streptomyces caelestis]|nr:hypothetical protein GCM10010320_46000 [Streptomyces caelestis]
MTATDPAAPRSVRPVPPSYRPRDGSPNAGRPAPGPRHGSVRLGWGGAPQRTVRTPEEPGIVRRLRLHTRIQLRTLSRRP